MKVYDTNYGPDIFGRIQMGLISEMFLSYQGYERPTPGDHLRISCTFQSVVREKITMRIVSSVDSDEAPDTVLLKVILVDKVASVSDLVCHDNGWSYSNSWNAKEKKLN
ncbi:hypothetical protein Q3V30_20740 [Erwinia pyri]|uniref:Uncharacterized protein n=1 Tax=Erwinia pyri TaxID=3062598 RepID=A0AA50HMS7_9GAMM|nr:hypothetical protein [Erwinia sp. DE2]WLS78817.1 hypothetical protein Q3V30_20740 [Erwinia sp. DE2]